MITDGLNCISCLVYPQWLRLLKFALKPYYTRCSFRHFCLRAAVFDDRSFFSYTSKHENQNPSLMKFQCYEIYESNRLITLQRSNKVTLKNRYLFVESYIFHNAEVFGRDFPLCLIFCFCFFMLTKMLLLQSILPFFSLMVLFFFFTFSSPCSHWPPDRNQKILAFY